MAEASQRAALDYARLCSTTLDVSSTQLRCSALSGTLIASVGSATWGALIRPRHHVCAAGPDAISGQRWLRSSSQPSNALERIHPGAAQNKLSQWLATLAPPRLAAGSRSCSTPALIGGAFVASSPLRPTKDHCRHPLSHRRQGMTAFPRCNPTRTLPCPAIRRARVGCGRGRHSPKPRSRRENMRAPGRLAAGYILHAHL